MENKVFVTLAKVDHIIFKANAYNTIVDAKYEKFSTHTECRLGKWYEGAGKDRFGNTSAYKSMTPPHKDVHDKVQDNLSFIKGSDTRIKNEAKISENFKAMEASSLKLFATMDEMVSQDTK